MGGEKGLHQGRGVRRRQLREWEMRKRLRGLRRDHGAGAQGMNGFSELARSSRERGLGTRMEFEDRLGLSRLSLALAWPHTCGSSLLKPSSQFVSRGEKG